MINFNKIFTLVMLYFHCLLLLLWSTAALYFYIVSCIDLIWPLDFGTIFFVAVFSFLYFYAFYLLINYVKKGVKYCREQIRLPADLKNVIMSIIIFLIIFALLVTFYTFFQIMIGV